MNNEFFMKVSTKHPSTTEVTFKFILLDQEEEMKKLLENRRKKNNDEDLLKKYEEDLKSGWEYYGNCWKIINLPREFTICNAYGIEVHLTDEVEFNDYQENHRLESDLFAGEDWIEYCSSLTDILGILYKEFRSRKDKDKVQEKFDKLGEILSNLNKDIKKLYYY